MATVPSDEQIIQFSVTSEAFPIDDGQLTVYLIFTLLSLLISVIIYIWYMCATDLSKTDRRQFMDKLYEIIEKEKM